MNQSLDDLIENKHIILINDVYVLMEFVYKNGFCLFIIAILFASICALISFSNVRNYGPNVYSCINLSYFSWVRQIPLWFYKFGSRNSSQAEISDRYSVQNNE